MMYAICQGEVSQIDEFAAMLRQEGADVLAVSVEDFKGTVGEAMLRVGVMKLMIKLRAHWRTMAHTDN